MAMTTVTARIASTHPVDKYDGIRFAREVMEQMADAFNAGTIPMNFDHSALLPLEATNVVARVVDLDDGESAVDMTFDIDEEVWRSIEERFSAAGVPGGFSFTAGVLQIAPADGREAVLVISADAAAFSDLERAEAGEVLSSLGPTQVNRLYQLSVVDLARVIIEIWPSLAIGVASSGLYDALRQLISGRREPTTIEIHRYRPDGSQTKAIIRTEDQEVVRIALENLAEEQETSAIHFDAERQIWCPSRRGTTRGTATRSQRRHRRRSLGLLVQLSVHQRLIGCGGVSFMSPQKSGGSDTGRRIQPQRRRPERRCREQ